MEKEDYEFPGIGFISLNPPSEDLKPFMRKKFRTLFRSLEANQNGVVRREDLVKIICRMYNEHPEEEKYRLSEKFVDGIYGKVLLFGRDSITENEYIEEWIKKIYSDPRTRKGWIEMLLPLMKMSFDNIRKPEDAAIGHNDFAEWFSKQGVNHNAFEDLFHLLDANTDGFISLEEFQFGLTNHHMCSGPESPFSLWFGPIIET